MQGVQEPSKDTSSKKKKQKNCNIVNCDKIATRRVEKPDEFGTFGPRCDTHFSRECNVFGCSSLKKYRVEVDDQHGPAGQRCEKHFFGKCNVNACDKIGYKKVDTDDHFAPAGRRCQRHACGQCNVPGCDKTGYRKTQEEDEYGPPGRRCAKHHLVLEKEYLIQCGNELEVGGGQNSFKIPDSNLHELSETARSIMESLSLPFSETIFDTPDPNQATSSIKESLSLPFSETIFDTPDPNQATSSIKESHTLPFSTTIFHAQKEATFSKKESLSLPFSETTISTHDPDEPGQSPFHSVMLDEDDDDTPIVTEQSPIHMNAATAPIRPFTFPLHLSNEDIDDVTYCNVIFCVNPGSLSVIEEDKYGPPGPRCPQHSIVL